MMIPCILLNSRTILFRVAGAAPPRVRCCDRPRSYPFPSTSSVRSAGRFLDAGWVCAGGAGAVTSTSGWVCAGGAGAATSTAGWVCAGAATSTAGWAMPSAISLSMSSHRPSASSTVARFRLIPSTPGESAVRPLRACLHRPSIHQYFVISSLQSHYYHS